VELVFHLLSRLAAPIARRSGPVLSTISSVAARSPASRTLQMRPVRRAIEPAVWLALHAHRRGKGKRAAVVLY
jgi:hypothetical protein